MIAYWVTSTGFVMSTHYCMDKVSSVQVGASHRDHCPICGMKSAKSNCCRDEVKVLKLQQDLQLAKTTVSVVKCSDLPVMVPAYVTAPFFNFNLRPLLIPYAPPPDQQPVYVVHRVFRI